MALRYLLDEHLRGPFWHAIERRNVTASEPLDVIRVGDSDGPALGADDSAILIWAEGEDRILVSADRHTLAVHLADHLAAGRRSPGILLVRPGTRIGDLVSFLELAASASEAAEWMNRIEYVP